MSPFTEKSAFIRSLTGIVLAGSLGISTAWAEPMSSPPPAGQEYEAHAKECRSERSGRQALKVVQSFYENLGKGNLPGIMANFARDAKWVLHAPAGTVIPFAGTHDGHAAVQKFIETFGANAKPSKFETREFIVDANKVAVLGYEEVTAIPTGKEWKAHWTMTFTVKNGKIILVDEAVDTEAISAAFSP